MSELVSVNDIERIVGCTRHETIHYGRAVSAEQVVYVLHSKECKHSGIDVQKCEYSLALDRGIDMQSWDRYEDKTVELTILNDGKLAPMP